jgi:hypothetical protein
MITSADSSPRQLCWLPSDRQPPWVFSVAVSDLKIAIGGRKGAVTILDFETMVQMLESTGVLA